MTLSNLDLFSTPFSFNTSNHQMKRGTLVGTFLSFSILVITSAYFVYMIRLYVTNQIDPTFRSQSLISQDLIEIPLNSDLVGFRFEIGDQQKLKPNKTYLVYLAFFQYISPDNSFLLPLNVIDCTNQNLLGFKCLDFSNVQNQTLFVNTSKNMRSQVEIMTYGCRDIDQLKTTIPDNCAEQKDIDTLINGINSVVRLKLFTSQFNTVTQSMDVNYRNAYVFTIANQAILTQIKTQKQQTSVKQGLFIQSQSSFQSPIQYTQQDQGYDRLYALQEIGGGPYSSVALFMDEIVQHIQIQYPTIPQIIALVSSIFTLLMFVGFIGRNISKNSIKSDFLILFLKNRYQGNYLQILKKNNYNINQNQQIYQNQDDKFSQENMQSDDQETKGYIEKENPQKILIPSICPKKKIYLETEQSHNTKAQNDNQDVLQKNIYYTNNQNQQQEIVKQNMVVDLALEESNIQKNQFSELKFIQFQRKNQKNNQHQSNSSCEVSQSDFLKKSSSFIKKRESIKFKTKNSGLQFHKDQQIFIENLKALKDVNCSQKVKQNLQQIMKKKQGLSNIQLKKLEYQIKQDMNIFNFIEDILLLKKAIMVLLTKDQLAALRLVGFSSSFIDQNFNSTNCDVQKLDNQGDLSHYEMQSAILRYQSIQDYYIQEFLSKCYDNDDLNEIDQRIISSIKKCNIV